MWQTLSGVNSNPVENRLVMRTSADSDPALTYDPFGRLWRVQGIDGSTVTTTSPGLVIASQKNPPAGRDVPPVKRSPVIASPTCPRDSLRGEDREKFERPE